MSQPQTDANMPMHKKILNTSGQGKTAIVPINISRNFNWGAFFFGWIWGLFNKTWITLIALGFGIVANVFSIGLQMQLKQNPQSIPQDALMNVLMYSIFVMAMTLGLQIWFGIKGNTWAWQNKRWENPQHFHSVQRAWAKWGVGLCVIFPLAIAIIGILFTLVIIPTLLMHH